MNISLRTGSVALAAAGVVAATLCTSPTAADPPQPPPSAAPSGEATGQDDDSSDEYLDRIALVGFITAGVGYATWAVTGSISLAKSESLKDDCPDDACPADVQSELDTARSLSQAATAGFVVGVLGTAWGVIALLAADDDEPQVESSASVRPTVGPGYVGIGGQF